jgi:hypothetical protein
MRDNYRVYRVLKSLRAEGLEGEPGDVCGLRGPRVEDFLRRGLIALADVDGEEGDAGDEPAMGQPVGPTCDLPGLGTFRFDDEGWVAPVHLSAFDAYRYGAPRQRKPRTVPFAFVAAKPRGRPAPTSVAVATRLVAHQNDFARTVADALWTDFAGTGPDSGMYWHGDLDEVARGIETGKPPRSADDLFKLMRLAGIRVRPLSARSRIAVAELNFDAAFEEDHGVGILTDGAAVLGIGYGADVSPFKPPRRRGAARSR